MLCGPFYQPLGVVSGNPPTVSERSGIVEVHKEAAKYAAASGIKLAVEPLNRFECYALNTVADTSSGEHGSLAGCRPCGSVLPCT